MAVNINVDIAQRDRDKKIIYLQTTILEWKAYIAVKHRGILEES